MDLISVIVPVYKVEPYLDRCVQSIVDQTYRNLEIILVDDGSPDRCGEMCDAWAEKDSRIRVIHKENGGLSDARNAGMAAATGDWIAFVDSDDWIGANMYEVMLTAAKHEECQIAACDVLFVQEGEIPRVHNWDMEPRICSSYDAIRDITQGIGFRAVAWNKLYRKDMLNGEMFPVDKFHEDEFVTYRILAKANKLIYINNPFYFYLQRKGSIMHTADLKRLDCLEAYLERLSFLQKRYPDIYLQDKATFCISCAAAYRAALRTKDPQISQYKEKICAFRKKVSFSIEEIKNYSFYQMVYIVGTRVFMDSFCRILNWRGGGD